MYMPGVHFSQNFGGRRVVSLGLGQKEVLFGPLFC